MPVVLEIEGGAPMNAPAPRVLRSYQERAATFLYERDAALLVAPLGAGKSTAALTAIAELIGDGHRRHALVVAPKLVATLCGRGKSRRGRTLGDSESPSSTAVRRSVASFSCRRRREN